MPRAAKSLGACLLAHVLTRDVVEQGLRVARKQHKQATHACSRIKRLQIPSDARINQTRASDKCARLTGAHASDKRGRLMEARV